MTDDGDYLKLLKKRSKKSRVYKEYQLMGLEIARILGDEKHKSLYIKLVKEKDAESLIAAAKGIAEKMDIKNKGAYFMSIIKSRIRTKNGK